MRSEELWGIALQHNFLEAGLQSRRGGLKPCLQCPMPNAVAGGDITIDYPLTAGDTFTADCRLPTDDCSKALL